jgi:hypothetical protein
MINKGVVSLTPVPDPLAKLIGPKKELEGQEGEAGIAAEGSEELEVIHTSNTECIKNNPEWFPGIEKKNYRNRWCKLLSFASQQKN